MSRKRSSSPVSTSLKELYQSEEIYDRKSRFIALYSPTLSPRELQDRATVKSASHRILAWRRPGRQCTLVSIERSSGSQKQTQVYETGFDDDGEKNAGKRVESVLIDMRAEGSLVVARWYGGVMLGPVRFQHMETVARQAIQMARCESNAQTSAKKPRLTTDEEEDSLERRRELAIVLEERDESILALRNLLAQKNSQATPPEKDKRIESKQTKIIRKPPLDYSAMPLVALKKLDQARDATIVWLLSQIDKAEKGKPSHADS